MPIKVVIVALDTDSNKVLFFEEYVSFDVMAAYLHGLLRKGEVDMRAETARFISECVWQGEHRDLMLLNVKFSA